MDNSVVANVLGTTGAVCWSVQLIPQIIVNYRRHHTTGLQPSMMLLWASAGIPLGVYNITQSFNIALQIQPQILSFLSLLTWAQCMYYREGGDDPRRWSVSKSLLVIGAIGTFMGGIEVGLFFALREAAKRHSEWPGILMAVLAAVLLDAGVARHYWDIYKERTVRGISFIFVGIDALGDLTSLISVFFQPELDVLGIVVYGSELLLWFGVFACGGWFNFWPWIQGLKSARGGRAGSASVAAQNAPVPNSHHETEEQPRSGSADSVISTGSVFRTASTCSRGAGQAPLENTSVRLRRLYPV